MKITETNSGIIGGMKGKEKCFLIKSKSNENLILNQKVYSGPNSAKRLHTAECGSYTYKQGYFVACQKDTQFYILQRVRNQYC